MTQRINVADFNLAATLECGQAFRWQRGADGWFTGIVGGDRRRVRQMGDNLECDWSRSVSCGSREAEAYASATKPVIRYFALDVSLPKIVATFPDDAVMREAVNRHWGLRVLRQEPWETLASFIASSTKQIVQIRQIVAALAERFGRARCPQRAAGSRLGGDTAPYHSFPSFEVIARASLSELTACKLGFRAKYLLAAAQAVDRGTIRLDKLPVMEYDRAIEELMKLDGVGEKIAACTLLFSCGHTDAFPIDVWVDRALRRLYFPDQKVTARQLRDFARVHFGPYAGWAQQYLFYDERTRSRQPLGNAGP